MRVVYMVIRGESSVKVVWQAAVDAMSRWSNRQTARFDTYRSNRTECVYQRGAAFGIVRTSQMPLSDHDARRRGATTTSTAGKKRIRSPIEQQTSSHDGTRPSTPRTGTQAGNDEVEDGDVQVQSDGHGAGRRVQYVMYVRLRATRPERLLLFKKLTRSSWPA